MFGVVVHLTCNDGFTVNKGNVEMTKQQMDIRREISLFAMIYNIQSLARSGVSYISRGRVRSGYNAR